MTEGKKAIWRPTRVTGSRKIDRSVAQHKMKQQGMRKINKPNMYRAESATVGSSPGRGSKRSGSVFADRWRQFAGV